MLRKRRMRDKATEPEGGSAVVIAGEEDVRISEVAEAEPVAGAVDGYSLLLLP